MDFFKRILGFKTIPPGGIPPLEAFPIHFPDGKTSLAVRVTEQDTADAVIQAFQLQHPRPTLFVSSGASAMGSEAANATRSILGDGLARYLSDRQISLVDGGTSSGAMNVVGHVRQRRGYTFPLIGVAPEKVVGYPINENPNTQIGLDAYHSHFILTGGEKFGAESEMILNFAYALSGRGAEKRLTMIVNGGEIVKKEAFLCATKEPTFPLLVLEGSGRFADELAASRREGSNDPMIQAILDKGIVHFISLKAGVDNFYRWLENFFGY